MTQDWDVEIVRGAAEAARAIDFRAEDVVSTAFQHPDWLAAWADAFADGDGDEPRVFLVEVRAKGSGRVLLRLPLALENRSGLSVMRVWDRGTADYGGPIPAADFALSPAAIGDLWKAVRAALPPCDLLLLQRMPARLGALDNPFLGLPGVEPSADCGHLLRLGGGVAERFDGTMHRSLARKRRKLGNKGALTLRFGPAGEAREALEALLGWRRERFAEENRGVDVTAVEDFWRRLAARSEIARIGELRLDGRLLAAAFGTRTGATFQLLATGFDTTWKNWSPGLILAEDLIAAAEADGIETFDFTIGDEAYKLDFDVEPTPLFDLIVPMSLRGRIAAGLRRLQIRRRRRRLECLRACRAAAG